jgi:hypothetical protein
MPMPSLKRRSESQAWAFAGRGSALTAKTAASTRRRFMMSPIRFLKKKIKD